MSAGDATSFSRRSTSFSPSMTAWYRSLHGRAEHLKLVVPYALMTSEFECSNSTQQHRALHSGPVQTASYRSLQRDRSCLAEAQMQGCHAFQSNLSSPSMTA